MVKMRASPETEMILIRGARQLLTLQGPARRRGCRLAELNMIVDGAVLVDGETILRVGPTRQVENLREARRAHVIEAHGKVILPGFVDSCTRLISGSPVLDDLDRQFSGNGDDRNRNFGNGAPLSSFRSLRNTSPTILRRSAQRWLKMAAAHGTTSLEVRSAQGLHLNSEAKALRAARDLDGKPLEIQPVIMAADPDAPGWEDQAGARNTVIEELLPEIKRRKLALYFALDADSDTFGSPSARMILNAARKLGLKLKIQSGARRPDSGVQLAMEMDAVGVDHLAFVRTSEIDALAKSTAVATLLPGVSQQQSLPFAPARQLIDSGVTVALASGFGATGGPTVNMAGVLSLACSQMGMSAAEAITAATANGAASLQASARMGSLEPGKQADLAIFDVGDYREIPYYGGINLCFLTMKKGRVIHSAPEFAERTPTGFAPGRAATISGREESWGQEVVNVLPNRSHLRT